MYEIFYAAILKFFSRGISSQRELPVFWIFVRFPAMSPARHKIYVARFVFILMDGVRKMARPVSKNCAREIGEKEFAREIGEKEFAREIRERHEKKKEVLPANYAKNANKKNFFLFAFISAIRGQTFFF